MTQVALAACVFAASAAVVVMSADGGTWLAVLAPGTITPVALADG